MSKIEIYARIKPTHRRYGGLDTSQNGVSIQIGQSREDGGRRRRERFARAPATHRDFVFSRTFDEDATQNEVYETVAVKIVKRFVDGYNGTIFAYGQTSTGKTYTMEGDINNAAEKGLIQRSLRYLYELVEEKKRYLFRQKLMQTISDSQELEKEKWEKEEGEEEEHRAPSSKAGQRDGASSAAVGVPLPQVKVQISYMEIYQDTGYDLLNPGARPGSLMLTLPKVQVRETAGGRVVVRDLSLHDAPSEQEALQLLHQGSACRKVAETIMNQRSSRSHAIFTVTMTTKQPGSEVIIRSKLHLVDLAGSERVYKNGTDGRVLQEAKYINLSLHHLEHVIVTLQHQSRNEERGGAAAGRCGHVPYRNSMLTMVLRDSLGGNCLTAMIATVSAEEDNILETVSTLRFSQRVACISNIARPNEELNDKAVIKKLKRRVVELEKELLTIRENRTLSPQMAQVSEGQSSMSDSEKKLCHRVLYNFFHGEISNPVEAGINTPALFQECLQVLRDIVITAVKTKSPTHPPPSSTPPSAQSFTPSRQCHPLIPTSTTTPPLSSATPTTSHKTNKYPPTNTDKLSVPLEITGKDGGKISENRNFSNSNKKHRKKKKKRRSGQERLRHHRQSEDDINHQGQPREAYPWKPREFLRTPVPHTETRQLNHLVTPPSSSSIFSSPSPPSTTTSARLSSTSGIGSLHEEEEEDDENVIKSKNSKISVIATPRRGPTAASSSTPSSPPKWAESKKRVILIPRSKSEITGKLLKSEKFLESTKTTSRPPQTTTVLGKKETQNLKTCRSPSSLSTTTAGVGAAAAMRNQDVPSTYRNGVVKSTGKAKATENLLKDIELEKELERKEDATRRRLEELKKQLVMSSPPPPSPPPPPPPPPRSQHLPTALFQSPSKISVELMGSPTKAECVEAGITRVTRVGGGGGVREGRGGGIERVTAIDKTKVISDSARVKSLLAASRTKREHSMRIRKCVSAATTIQRAWRKHHLVIT